MPIHEVFGNEVAALLIPTTVTLITARDEAGETCVATIAWVTPISHEPPMLAVSIRPGGRTSNAIVSGGCFVVNVLAPGMKHEAVVCGTKRGIEDRVREADLLLVPAENVASMRVEQCASWLECELVDHTIYGDHELYIGRVLCAQTRGELTGEGKVIPGNALVMGQRGCFGHFKED